MPFLKDLENMILIKTEEKNRLTLSFHSTDPDVKEKYLTKLNLDDLEKPATADYAWGVSAETLLKGRLESKSTPELEESLKLITKPARVVIHDFPQPRQSQLVNTLPDLINNPVHGLHDGIGGWDGAMFGGGIAQVLHHAFTRHMPVSFKPDDFHLLIMQGLSLLIQK